MLLEVASEGGHCNLCAAQLVLDVGAKVVGSLVDDLLKFALLPDKLLLGQLLDLCFDLSIIKFKINELVAGRTLARTLLHFLGLDFLQFVPKRAKRLLADIWLLGSGKAFKRNVVKFSVTYGRIRRCLLGSHQRMPCRN